MATSLATGTELGNKAKKGRVKKNETARQYKGNTVVPVVAEVDANFCTVIYGTVWYRKVP